MNAIVAQGLSKHYGAKKAVDHLNLTVEKGELMALLGVNGAGKTTAIRMFSCLSSATEGSCSICGYSCQTEQAQVKKRIGISPQDTAVAENLTVKENLQFMAQVHGMDKEKTGRKVQEMMPIWLP